MAQNAFYTRLQNRGLITISGPDRFDFLQGLITNDLEKLTPESLIYSCLLTPQGKFLFDFFVSKDSDHIYLDCEGGQRAVSLAQSLTKYMLRSDVAFDVKPDHPVFTVFGSQEGIPDPRHASMGNRSFEEPETIPEESFMEWDRRRIMLSIPDGSRDLVPEHSTMDEGHLDQFNAIDYDKGCYIGQELTARMHYRGLGKKHLYGIEFQTKTYNPGQEIVIQGKSAGEMRSRCDRFGMALLKDSEVQNIPLTYFKTIETP